MSWIEADRSQIAKSSHLLIFVGGAYCVTAIFNQPQVVAAGKVYHCIQVKRVAQGMRNHHGACALGMCVLQLRYIDVVGRDRGVHKNRRQSILDDRIDRRWEASGNRDHLIARL